MTIPGPERAMTHRMLMSIRTQATLTTGKARRWPSPGFSDLPDDAADQVDALEFFIERFKVGGDAHLRVDFDNFRTDAPRVK